MIDFFKKIGNFIATQFEPIREFLYQNRNNPFLWISLVLFGIIVSKLTYDALTRGREQ